MFSLTLKAFQFCPLASFERKKKHGFKTVTGACTGKSASERFSGCKLPLHCLFCCCVGERHAWKPASRKETSEDVTLSNVRQEIQNEFAESKMPIQKLYNACKQAFTRTGVPISTQALQQVRTLLDSMEPADVGLDENAVIPPDKNGGFFGKLSGRRIQHSPPISYLHIYECGEFSMGIFCFPASAIIPLHNHPGMTVLSKLLYGSMHVRAYDWIEQTELSYPRLAKKVVDRVISAPCDSAILYPTSGGNIHAFTAVTSCAVLDVLAPPYSMKDERHCTYFRELPCSQNAGGDQEDDPTEVYLEEFPPPNDFSVKGAPYRGPQLVL